MAPVNYFTNNCNNLRKNLNLTDHFAVTDPYGPHQFGPLRKLNKSQALLPWIFKNKKEHYICGDSRNAKTLRNLLRQKYTKSNKTIKCFHGKIRTQARFPNISNHFLILARLKRTALMLRQKFFYGLFQVLSYFSDFIFQRRKILALFHTVISVRTPPNIFTSTVLICITVDL